MDWIKYFLIDKSQSHIAVGLQYEEVLFNVNTNQVFRITRLLYKRIYEVCKVRHKKIYIGPICYYKHDNHNSILYTWRENGSLANNAKYKNGTRHGIEYAWYSNGQISNITKYEKGKIHGKNYSWHNNKIICSITRYRYGRLHGIEYQWYINGSICTMSLYKHNKKDGVEYNWYKYHYMGPHCKIMYKNGEKNI